MKKTYKDRAQYEFDYKQHVVVRSLFKMKDAGSILYTWSIMTFVYSIYSI